MAPGFKQRSISLLELCGFVSGRGEICGAGSRLTGECLLGVPERMKQLIHQYKSNGYNIVMDVNSGSIHVVDDLVYDIIPLAEPFIQEGVRDRDTVKAALGNLVNFPCSQEELGEAVDEIL